MKKLIVLAVLVVMAFAVIGCKNPASSGTTNRPPVDEIPVDDGTGSGTEADPFIVGSAASLAKVGSGTDGWGLNSHYLQKANITLSGEWTSIGGTATSASNFTGTYDGAGFSINNMRITGSTVGFQGLFRAIGMTGVVRNVAMRNVDINLTVNNVGGIAGLNNGMIQNSYVSGSITGGNTVGGIAGNNFSNGSIQNCYTTCNVTGENNVGGIAGHNFGDTLSNGLIRVCYATGNITGNDKVGGIIGENLGNVEYNVALNRKVASTTTEGAWRVAATYEGYLEDNFARSDMVVERDGSPRPPDEMNIGGWHRGGADATAAQTHGADSNTWWSIAIPDGPGFHTDDWSFAANRLPHLKTTEGEAFNQAQNPAVQ